MSNEHSNQTVSYQCDDCDLVLTNFGDMIKHARKTKHQLTRFRTCKCIECDNKAYSLDKPYYCKSCASGNCGSCGLGSRGG
ncbi:MAG: hypothetical protein IIC67_05285 [Thaumarchaeota archaeon]|nr:hypothetical protein [Nitrososphaerota archaeon]